MRIGQGSVVFGGFIGLLHGKRVFGHCSGRFADDAGAKVVFDQCLTQRFKGRSEAFIRKGQMSLFAGRRIFDLGKMTVEIPRRFVSQCFSDFREHTPLTVCIREKPAAGAGIHVAKLHHGSQTRVGFAKRNHFRKGA